MPWTMLPDGTEKEVTWDELREMRGEEAVRDLQVPPISKSGMTEGHRVLSERMQSEAELNASLYEEGRTLGDIVPGFEANRRRRAEEAAAAKQSSPPEPPTVADKLPDYRPGPRVVRGAQLSPKQLEQYMVDEIVTERGFTSTSADIDKRFEGNVRFVIESKHGKLISFLSAYPEEQEVMFQAGTRFRVLSRDRMRYDDRDVVRIEMVEIDDA